MVENQPDSLEVMLARIEKNAKRRNAERGYQDGPSVKTTILKLPLWPDGFTGIPNGILRSALFSIVRKGTREYQHCASKTIREGITVSFTGYQLDQADLDVWENCIRLVHKQALGCRVSFTLYEFLKAIKRHPKGENVAWLSASLVRLTTSTLLIKAANLQFQGTLIEYLYKAEDGTHEVSLNPKIIDLYNTGWTQIELAQRLKLRRHPLAQWLHGFYCTHAKPYPLKVKTIHDMSGSNYAELRFFKRDLQKALRLIESEIGWEWLIDEADNVHINKQPTPSQARHLAKVAKKPQKPTRPP
ncbi:MAG: Replication initiator protein A [Chromatium okenii]|nr:Replication initiator protein A [Chromatium okenii]